MSTRFTKVPLAVTRVPKVDAAVTRSSCWFVVLRFVGLLLLLPGTWVPRAAAAAPTSEAAEAKAQRSAEVKAKRAEVKAKRAAVKAQRAAVKAQKAAEVKAKRAEAKAQRSAEVKAKRAAAKAKRAAKAKKVALAKATERSAARPAVDQDVSSAEEEASAETAPTAATPAPAEHEPLPTVDVQPTAEPSPMVELTPEPSRAAGGPRAHVSLETSGYLDTEHVSVLSPTVAGAITDEVRGWSVNGHYLVDIVSAASVDIVSTASPHWTEVRHVGGLSGSIAVDPVTVGATAVVSREPDYLSITGGATLSLDLLEKNLTPYLAFSREQDSVGRTDLPHAYWQSKHVTNLQVGLTAVLGRSTIGSVQWDGSFERGYLGKPYRYVPLFALGQGSSIGAGASIDEVNRLRLSLRPNEQVPSSRDRYAVSGHLAHRAGESTLRLDERLYVDDWGLLAATSELRYIIDVGRRLELWPHVRHHIQGAVNFWQRAPEAIAGPEGTLGVPVFRTGDRELSPLQTIVLGAGARLKLSEPPGNQWDLVFEIDAGRTRFSDALYISQRLMGYSTLAIEAVF
jgi:Protein of unknown function (DUF3570)